MTTAPTSDQFANDLTAFIAAEVATTDESIERETDLLLSGLVDSLGIVMVSDWIQERLAIVINPVDMVLENFQTVGAMTGYVIARGAVAAT